MEMERLSSHRRFASLAAKVAAALFIAVPMMGATGKSAAPDFTLNARGGQQITLSKLKGQVVMINFWATWCGPCRQEMPLLENIYKKYNKLGFTLLGVNVEPDPKAADAFLAKQTPVTFPILYDTESKVTGLYEVNSMPSTVIVDRQGNVRMLHRGYKAGDENEYLDQIRTLIREK
jgi:thiol-disulfide isomerase/thioredoxin